MSILPIEIFLLCLLIGAMYLEFKYPCNHLVKLLLTIVVLIKIVLIAYIYKHKGEQEGEKKEKVEAMAACQRQLNLKNKM